MTFKEWFKEIVEDANYLGKDLSKEAWNHQQAKLDKLTEHIKDQKEREEETMREEPCNSHIGSMASGAHEAYVEIEEFLKELS